jgi:hypothetical protein
LNRETAVSSVLIFCASCGRQVPSSETQARLCLDCRVSQALEPLRREHARLWRKRERYQRQGARLESLDRQAARVEERMAERIRDLVSNDERAAEYLNKEMEAARQARYDIRTR